MDPYGFHSGNYIDLYRWHADPYGSIRLKNRTDVRMDPYGFRNNICTDPYRSTAEKGVANLPLFLIWEIFILKPPFSYKLKPVLTFYVLLKLYKPIYHLNQLDIKMTAVKKWMGMGLILNFGIFFSF